MFPPASRGAKTALELMGKNPKRALSESSPETRLPIVQPPSSGARKWVFRFAALLLPLLVLAVTEFVLRLVGYGYPTAFALRKHLAAKTVFVDNHQFARRYFPPGLARSPQPFLFGAEKPANTTRIFVFGESAAMGDPEPAYGFARMLEVLLKARYPGRNFEVINAGVTAINSHVIRDIARDLAPRQGDIWIIYMGNNEVIGPFGAGTVFGAQTPRLGFIRAGAAFKKLRLGQLLDDFRYRLGGKGRTQTWEGMEMFLKQQVAADDRRMTKVYEHFEANLRDILDVGTKAGAKILVSTVASNLKDCPPFASLHKRGFGPTNEWHRLYEAGSMRAGEANYAAALQLFQQAAALDDRHAELQFQIARCCLAVGQTNEAHQAFVLARDLDALRFRADSRINQIIHNAASAQKSSVKLVDAADAINRATTTGIAGNELLFEHVHFNFEGNYSVAALLGEAMADLLPFRHDGNDHPGANECARSLGFTLWDELQLTDEMIKRFGQAPFTHQFGHAARMAGWEARRADLQNRWQPAAFDTAVQTYRYALSNAPGDWVLRQNFAKLLQAIGEPKDAENQWRALVELMPHYADACYSLANVLDAQGRGAEALEYFQRALRAKPESIEARNGIGLALANLGRKQEAMDQYHKALAQKPDFAEARVNLGQLFAQQGEEEQAKAQYTLALRYNSNTVAAHINLGKLLAKENKYPEAIAHYRDALRIDPANAIGHYNLGNALTALGDPQAAFHFAEAVKHNPRFAEARYNLAMQLAKQNRHEEVLAHLAEVVRLKPGFVDGHFNYAVALAKARRFDEATAQFETVLRIDPGHAGARQLLERAKGRGN
jgi:tetratricopeptide (TPR) repeat protein